jgi:hypothetical protein
MFDRSPLYRNMDENFKELGIPYYYAQYIPFADAKDQDYGPFKDGDPVVIYGSINFVKKCPRVFVPGAYGYTQNRQCNVYMTNIPHDWFLNSDYIMLPWGDLKARWKEVYVDLLKCYEIFIRPMSGDKSFTGQAIFYSDFLFEANSTQQLTSVTDETIVMIAKSKKQEIKGEFRFIIGAGEVIAGSEYRWDGNLDIRRDWPAECEALAKQVAELPWQLDTVYTCDVALMADGVPKIVELNGFASAGWYAADQKKIISRVTEIAEAEHAENI